MSQRKSSYITSRKTTDYLIKKAFMYILMYLNALDPNTDGTETSEWRDAIIQLCDNLDKKIRAYRKRAYISPSVIKLQIEVNEALITVSMYTATSDRIVVHSESVSNNNKPSLINVDVSRAIIDRKLEWIKLK